MQLTVPPHWGDERNTNNGKNMTTYACENCGKTDGKKYHNDICSTCGHQFYTLSPEYHLGYADGFGGFGNLELSEDYASGYADGRSEREWQLDKAEQHPRGYDWQR